MSDPSKITIEKRIFKIGNNETFLLEYPSNYEEIANMKISKLQKDYESVTFNNKNQSSNINQIKIKKENIDKEKIVEKNNLNLDDKNNYNNYYQPIGKNVEIFSINNETDDKNINNNNIDNKIPLDPKEGFIEIKNEKKENISNNMNDEEINNEEFYEVEEKEIEENKKERNTKEINIKNESIDEKKTSDKNNNKINLSPIKSPENIKIAMKKLNFKAPKWAESMTDKDIINMAKNIISSKKKQ